MDHFCGSVIAGQDPMSADGRTVLYSTNFDFLANGNIETRIYDLSTVEHTRQMLPGDPYPFDRPPPEQGDPFERDFWMFEKEALDALRLQQFPTGDYPEDAEWKPYEHQ